MDIRVLQALINRRHPQSKAALQDLLQAELGQSLTTFLAARLGQMEIFQSLPEPLLLELAEQSAILSVPADAPVFHKNDPGGSLYLLLSGEARVHDDDYTVAHIHEGACFGEMSLLDEGQRSMSISATEDALLARIDREAFFGIVSHYPELLQKIVALLTRRLRFQTDQTVAQLRLREAELTRLVEERTAELLRQKEEAEQQRRRAEQSERAEQQFLANMSHEIRTPMNAVMGMTKLLLQKSPREDQLKYLYGIQKSSEALLVILNDILDISKVQAGRMELEWIDLDVAAILDTVRTTLQYRAEEKGLALEVFCDPAIPPVLVGDPTRLLQILLNLAGNAVKFTEKGRVDILTHGTLLPDRRCALHFEVCDTGIGMTPEQLEQVFVSFKQASGETTRKYGGTGLGLSISKQLTELFGGRIEVQSKPGEGSVFHVYLELDIADSGKTSADDFPVNPETLRGKRILIAEDNEFNRIVAVETLQILIPDVRITTAENGLEALEAVQNETFDVVLMDVSMPVMDGLEATRAIRALPPPLNRLPIIAFTASVTSKEVRTCLSAGMNACVPKPFNDMELIQALSNLQAPGTIPTQPVQPGIEGIRQIAGADPARLKKYLQLYLDSANTNLPRIEAALAAGDTDALRKAVHTMKPQFKLLNLPEIAALAQTIETQALEGTDPELLPGNVARLSDAIRQSLSWAEGIIGAVEGG